MRHQVRLCHFPMSVTNGNALAGPSWHRWDSNNVQCLSCVSLLPKPQLQHSSSPLYFLKWTKGDCAAPQIPKYHHAIPLVWKYAMPWCREVTLILMNSLQDFQRDYFPPIIWGWEANPVKETKPNCENFLLQAKANALLTVSQVWVFSLENVYRHVFDHGIGNMSWEHAQICIRINTAARSHLTVISRHPGAPRKLSVGLEGIQPGESKATMWLGWPVPQENCALMNGKRSKRELRGRACKEITSQEPSCA